MLLSASLPRAAVPRRQAGMSLVEMMVAVLIGLIGILVMFQMFSLVEGQRRTTISGTDAQANGMFALYALQADLRQAGYGINWSAVLACNAVQAYDGQQGGVLPAFPLAPVLITQGTATESDALAVTYGSSPQSVLATRLSQNMTSAVNDYVVTSRFGFQVGDAILVAEAGRPCTLAQVSGLPAASNALQHASSAAFRYNAPDDFNTTYTRAASVYNLGPAPVRNIYTVDANLANRDFVVRNFLAAAAGTEQALAPQIVQLRAQYGRDTNGDGLVDTFDNTTPTTANGWRQVLAVRVGMVARSSQPERPTAGGACDATAAAPTWAGGAFNLTANANWQCYRYRVFETTVPLRNQIWSQE